MSLTNAMIEAGGQDPSTGLPCNHVWMHPVGAYDLAGFVCMKCLAPFGGFMSVERKYELFIWAVCREEVHASALTEGEIIQLVQLARMGELDFNQIGSTSYYQFGDTGRTHEILAVLREQLAIKERAKAYLEEALF